VTPEEMACCCDRACAYRCEACRPSTVLETFHLRPSASHPTAAADPPNGDATEPVPSPAEDSGLRDPLPTHRLSGKAAVSEDVPDDHPVGAHPSCNHAKFWKRLRANRGFAYFVCYHCGAKWRTSTKTRAAASTGQPDEAESVALMATEAS
jgi:hypothetical protein